MPADMRKAISHAVTLSKQTIPHYYLSIHADLSRSLKRLDEWNATKHEVNRISINDLILRATALSLIQHPRFNGFFQNDAFCPESSINLGVAIALPDGLIAPAILGCQSLPLEQITQRRRDLAARARVGRLRAEEYGAATFTVSNLGMYRIDSFIAVIVPPQVGILAVGALTDILVRRDQESVWSRQLVLTLSADHRVTDGAQGALFLSAIAANLETPEELFARGSD